MQLLETTLNNLVVSGFRRNQTHLFNMNHLITMIAVILHLAFFYFGADNVDEYVTSAYFTTTALGILISCTNSICKAPAIFTLIDNTQNFVDKRKCIFSDMEDFSILYFATNFFHLSRNPIFKTERNLHKNPSNCGKIQ